MSKQVRSGFLMVAVAVAATALSAAFPARAAEPANFLFLDADDMSDHRDMLARPDIAGGQIIYSWRLLEPRKDHYDFSKLEQDLAVARKLHKKLWVAISDRTFSFKWKSFPDYLSEDPEYQGGTVFQYSYPGTKPGTNKTPNGLVAMQWNAAVRDRYQKLLRALAARFDGAIYGIDLGETAMDANLPDGEKGFTCDGYFDAEMENIAVAREAFHKTAVTMFANFWPCEWNDSRHYMSRAFAYAAAHDIAMGGPDIYPFNRAQMKNSYGLLNEYRGKLKLVAMSVQEPDLDFIDDKTGKPFTKESFTSFARDYLGANIIFWAYTSPGLQLPPHR
ncbi:MAG TPA: hypothetical protein VGE93_01195 [Bryobacteraceae bacterium]